MSKIENMEQLQSEIKRLRAISKQQELQIKNDLLEVREDLKPRNILLNAVSSISGVNMNKKDFFQDGIARGISIFIQRFILKAEKKMENKIYDFVDTVLEKLKATVNKYTGPEAKRDERREN